MLYLSEYDSLLGKITLGSNGEALTALWLPGQTCAEKLLSAQHEYAEAPAISEAKRWLDIYFSGKEPDFFPALAPEGTAFQLEVWNLLRQIPYGKTTTYGALAAEAAKRRGKEKMSAQAVGNAVGSNPISIIVPCHRVVGAGGSLTGYNGGIKYKTALLKLEGSYSECGIRNPECGIT